MLTSDMGSFETAAIRDPLGRALGFDLVEEYAPMGIVLRLETNSPLIIDAARNAFGRYGTSLPYPESPRFAVRLLVEPSFSESGPWPEPVFRGLGNFFYVCVGRQNTAIADLGRRQAAGFVAPAMAQDSAFLQKTFLECLVFTMLTHGPGATHTYVHASAVVKNDRGFLFCGPSESGKSTLAFACARQGFRILADDVVYLKQHENELSAWGRPWWMRFLSDCAIRFPELNQGREGNGIIEIDIDELLPGCTQVCCSPAALFFLDRTADRAECMELTQEDAARLLERDLMYDSREVMEKHCRTWFQLAGRGSYRLRYGDDLESAVRLLESLE